jgi:hypothetical protein
MKCPEFSPVAVLILSHNMSPTPLISTRPASERRAAAARANGARSRGPVTAQGQANSRGNRRTHGLRSRSLFPDHRTDPGWLRLLAAYEQKFRPCGAAESRLIETLALCQWRRSFIWKLEQSVLDARLERVAPAPNVFTPKDAAPDFRKLAGVLDRLQRVELALSNKYSQTLEDLHAIRRARAGVAAHATAENKNVNVRTQQPAENNGSDPNSASRNTPLAALVGASDCPAGHTPIPASRVHAQLPKPTVAENENVNVRTQQITENNESGQNPVPGGTRVGEIPWLPPPQPNPPCHRTALAFRPL